MEAPARLQGNWRGVGARHLREARGDIRKSAGSARLNGTESSGGRHGRYGLVNTGYGPASSLLGGRRAPRTLTRLCIARGGLASSRSNCGSRDNTKHRGSGSRHRRLGGRRGSRISPHRLSNSGFEVR